MPSQLPCEKCGKMTTYDGLIGTSTKLPCGHCGTPRPHTMRGATGCGGGIFMIFFVVAFLMVLINGDESILIIFPIFFLMFLILFAWVVIVGLKMKREAKKKAVQEKNLNRE